MVRPMLRARPQRWLAAITALALVAGVWLIPTASVSAGEPRDMVLDWNAYAINAIGGPPTATPPGAGQVPPYSPIHLAMVQGAVYDAVNAIDRRHEPYLDGLPKTKRSASKAAAAATAAHHVLVGLVPALPQAVRDSVDGLYAGSLAEIKNGKAKTRGIAIGAAAASAMLANRANDGRFIPYAFAEGSDPGEWRPVLPLFVSDPFAWVSNVRPFTLKRTGQFRTKGPLDLASAKYAREFNEVKTLGAATGSSRTPEQTLLAQFVTTNPVPMLNRALREIAVKRHLSTAQQARLFAQTSMASADALINCWDDKDHWNFWRPITAIREAADDGNPATAPQADWLPMFATAPYPEHPSGFNCFTAAMMYSARAFFGTDRMRFELTNPGTTPPMTRTYKRFTDVVDDAIDGRIYNGFHFRTADVQGAWIGKKVARWVDRHFFERAH